MIKKKVRVAKKSPATKIKKTVTNVFELPKEIVYNLPLLSLIGNDELNIENYKGVIEYSEEKIRLNTSIGVLRIEGKRLFLKQITAETVTITGHIEKIEFVQ